ncbi:MAG TPA: hypothetical protein VGB23_04400 [Nitrospirota bacterium]
MEAHDSTASGRFLVTRYNVDTNLKMLKDCAKSLDCDAFLKEDRPPGDVYRGW